MEFLNIFELKAKFPESTEWVTETPKCLKISIKTYRAHFLTVSMHFSERFRRKCPLFQSLGCSLVAFSGNGVELGMKQIKGKKNIHIRLES